VASGAAGAGACDWQPVIASGAANTLANKSGTKFLNNERIVLLQENLYTWMLTGSRTTSRCGDIEAFNRYLGVVLKGC